MITQAKRIRTKKGDPMTFATLDDLEGSVELLVFGRALGSSEDALAPDSVVLVRGRVDHRDREKTCVVAQQIDPFEPDEDELQQAAEIEARRPTKPTLVRLRLLATALPGDILGELKEVLAAFPGECEVMIDLQMSEGCRRLRLGPEFRVTRSAALHAELVDRLGEAMLSDGGGEGKTEPAGPEADVASPEEPDPSDRELAAASGPAEAAAAVSA
jgi:DNA polymerase-3 subunit alpha